MYDIIKADYVFRCKILSVLLHTDWLARYGLVIIPEFFPTDNERDFVTWLNKYYTTYRNPPGEDAIYHGFGECELVEDVLDADDADLQYVCDIALDFAKVQSMKIAILQSVDDIQDGDLHKPAERVRDALKVGDDQLDMGLDLISDIDDWVYDELHGRRVPTGWPNLDNVLGGGLVPGEYGLVMAPPGKGKTTALVNIGYNAAGLIGSANVLHISHEMPASKVLKRYGALVSGVRLSRGDAPDGFIERFQRMAKAKLKAKIRVKHMANCSVLDIARLIDSLISEGFKPDLLIDDYPDLMRATTRRNEKRFELAEISRELRDLGNEYDMVVWGATQSGRHTFNKPVISQQDVAEAIEKVAIADILLALCQTKDEEQLGQGRLFVPKIRDAESNLFIPVKVNFKLQSIVQRGRSE